MLVRRAGNRAVVFAFVWFASFPFAHRGTAAVTNGGDLPSTGPQFSSYPARANFRGTPAHVRLDDAQARRFRTRLREDSRQGPNFAGHYTVVFWGCGSGCAGMAVVDAYTGRVTWLPLDWIDIPDEQDVKPNRNYRLDSRLLVVTRSHYDASASFTAYYYLIEKGRFRLIRKLEGNHSDG